MVRVKLVAPDRCVPISSWGGWLGVALLTELCPSFACHVYEEVLSVAAQLILPANKRVTPIALRRLKCLSGAKNLQGWFCIGYLYPGTGTWTFLSPPSKLARKLQTCRLHATI